MNPEKKLFAIKLVHTLIWAFFVVVIFYVLYSGITNKVNLYTWISIILVIGEGFTFEIGLLDNGELIQFGLPFEYILTPTDKTYSKMTNMVNGDILIKK